MSLSVNGGPRSNLGCAMQREDSIMSELLYTVGRVLIPIVFIVSGIEHCINVQSLADALAAANLPFPPQVDQYVPLPKYQALAYLVAGIEAIAGVLIAIGFLTRLAAFVLFVYCGLTIFFVHHFWNMAAQMAHQIDALTNLALMGAMLLLMARGAGGYSLDGAGEHAGDKAQTAHGAPAAQTA
jgi:putative oxidoreductase